MAGVTYEAGSVFRTLPATAALKPQVVKLTAGLGTAQTDYTTDVLTAADANQDNNNALFVRAINGIIDALYTAGVIERGTYA